LTGQISASSDQASAALVATPESELGAPVGAPANVSAFLLQNLPKAGPLGSKLDLTDRVTRITLVVSGLLLIASDSQAVATSPALYTAAIGAIAMRAFPALTADLYTKAMTDLSDKFAEGISQGRSQDETVQSTYGILVASGSVGIGSVPKITSRAGGRTA
jgi:hypothetical protein